MQIQIKSDLKQANQSLLVLQQTVQNMAPINRQIAIGLRRNTAQRFKSKTAPDGTPWQPNAPSTLKRKKSGRSYGSLLIGQTKVLSAIQRRHNANEVVIGTPAIYGRIHQLGGKAGRGHKVTIPARPFLGVSKEDENVIHAIIEKAFKG